VPDTRPEIEAESALGDDAGSRRVRDTDVALAQPYDHLLEAGGRHAETHEAVEIREQAALIGGERPISTTGGGPPPLAAGRP
jgi:hypothetical protein